MITYTDRIVLLFPIPAYGQHSARPAAASLQELEYTDSGKVFENLIPLDVSKVGDYSQSFSLGALAERDTALSQLFAETTAHNVTKASLSAMIAERDALQTQVHAIPGLQGQIATLTAEVERLTALVPPAVPDVLASTDWVQFRARILSNAAVQRVAIGNPTAWPLVVLYLSQLATTPSRGVDLAQLWSFLIVSTPITADEVAGINTIANECGVPMVMNPDGSIGQ